MASTGMLATRKYYRSPKINNIQAICCKSCNMWFRVRELYRKFGSDPPGPVAFPAHITAFDDVVYI